MLNGVNLNYIIVLLVTGSVLLAAIYHTILYNHRKTALLARYSAYLWSTFLYCAFRSFFFDGTSSFVSFINLDEVLQMIAFVFYIRFAGTAMDLHPQREKYAWRFIRLTPYIVFVYLLVNTFLTNADDSHMVYVIAKISIRGYLLFMGLFLLLAVVRKRPSTFYHYLAAGAVSMIVCGLISSVVNLLATGHFLLGALSWLMFGFFTDVVFFSAAISYRIREEYQQREDSLQQLLRKEAELQQKELEKLKAVYETREEERLRIARDLHDDMGSTLSSISIYSKVAGTYLETDPKKAENFLTRIHNYAGLLMEHTNDLIWSLQTNYGATESLFTRMQKTAVEMLSSASIIPHILMQEELPFLNITAQKACWLIFKEAVNNVCKYSRAANCTVSIHKNGKIFQIIISDDGIGFIPGKSGNGLKNMISRAASLGGECCIQSSEKGTCVTTTLPLQNISILSTHQKAGYESSKI